MADTNETLVYSAAVRGFHVYQDVWKPLENEELICLFERHNLFDMFAIKTCHLKFFFGEILARTYFRELPNS